MSDSAIRSSWPVVVAVVALAIVVGVLMMISTTDNATPPSSTSGREDRAAGENDRADLPVVTRGNGAPETGIPPAETKPVPVYYAPKKIEPPEGADPSLKEMFESWREAIMKRHPQQMHQAAGDIDSCGVKAIPWLLKIYREDEQERVRAHAVRILGRLRNTSLIDFFVEVLAVDKGEDVRYNAAWSLGELRHAGAVGDLERAAVGDASEKVRREAKSAVEKIHLAMKGN